MRSCSNPGFAFVRLRKVRINKAEQSSRASDREICVTTSPFSRRWLIAPPDFHSDYSLRTWAAVICDDRHAGNAPQSKLASTTSARIPATANRSVEVFSAIGLEFAGMKSASEGAVQVVSSVAIAPAVMET